MICRLLRENKRRSCYSTYTVVPSEDFTEIDKMNVRAPLLRAPLISTRKMGIVSMQFFPEALWFQYAILQNMRFTQR